jgi:hypothetical protein
VHPSTVIRKLSMYYRLFMIIKGHTLSKLCIEAKSKGFEKLAGGTPWRSLDDPSGFGVLFSSAKEVDQNINTHHLVTNYDKEAK